MKTLFFKICLLLPIGALIVGVNWFFDPAKLFSGGRYERKVAALMLEGHHVGNVANFDERLLQKYYVEGLSTQKDVVVLGSSRGLQLGRELFPGRDFFNHSVSGAVFEDLVAIYGLYAKQGKSPETVIVCVDPWVFNREHQQRRWMSLADEYLLLAEKIGIKAEMWDSQGRVFIDKYLELLSLSYFQKAFELAWKGKKDTLEPVPVANAEMYSAAVVRRNDGRLIYAPETRQRRPENVDVLARKYVSKDPVYLLGGFKQADAALVQNFNQFINYLAGQAQEVILLMPPYHPLVYNFFRLNEGYHVVLSVEEQLAQMTFRSNVQIVGSFNPYRYGLSSHDFYDGMHPKPEAFARIWQIHQLKEPSRQIKKGML